MKRKEFGRFKNQTLEKWLKIRKTNRDATEKNKTQRRAIYDTLKNVLPTPLETRALSSVLTNAITVYLQTASPKPSEPRTPGNVSVETPQRTISDIEPIPSTSTGGLLETPWRTIKGEDGGRSHALQDFGVVASPYVKPYFAHDVFLDNHYGIRREGDAFFIGDSKVSIDMNSNLTMKG
jgi:hypothetical protein